MLVSLPAATARFDQPQTLQAETHASALGRHEWLMSRQVGRVSGRRGRA